MRDRRDVRDVRESGGLPDAHGAPGKPAHPAGRPVKLNEPLWSLSYEFWYYIAFSFLAIALTAKSPAPRRWLSFCALVMLLAYCGAYITSYSYLADLRCGYRCPSTARLAVAMGCHWYDPSLRPTIVVAVGTSRPFFCNGPDDRRNCLNPALAATRLSQARAGNFLQES
jgi:hypothetical protein